MNLKNLRTYWNQINPKQRIKLFQSFPEDIQKYLITSWQWLARDKQLLPEDWEKDYNKIVWLTGRGFGKTRTAVETICDFIENPPTKNLRVGAINKTGSDAKDISILGESGFLSVLRRRGYREVEKKPKGKQFIYRRSLGEMCLLFANGCQINFFSAEKPDKFAGYQFHILWLDEAFLWPKLEECWKIFSFCMRLPGMKPLYLITSTPRPVKRLRTLLKDPTAYIIKGTLGENAANLSPEFIKDIYGAYDGTRWGKQEIYGEMLEDNPDALWQPRQLEKIRINISQKSPDQITKHLNLVRIVIAIDPAVTSGDKADETGLIVAGINSEKIGFILEDHSGRYTPERWAQLVSNIYEKWELDRVIAEVNNGGDLVETVLRTHNPRISYKSVRASKGKRIRAEPIAALYEQNKVKHVGLFPELEDQMTMYTPDNYEGSPDRVDALVYALTELMLNNEPKMWFI
jgi:phage terminase large subunit-like protein